jgi:hypothetical protein
MTNIITYCGNCPFNVPGGEHSPYCNHPLSNNKSLTLLNKYIDNNNLPIDKTTNKQYHHETTIIPSWCPLKSLNKINIGIIVDIQLDDQLFD